MSRVVLVLVPGVHLLDLAGPAQAFSSAAQEGYAYRLSYVAEEPEVLTAQGLPLRAETAVRRPQRTLCRDRGGGEARVR